MSFYETVREVDTLLADDPRCTGSAAVLSRFNEIHDRALYLDRLNELLGELADGKQVDMNVIGPNSIRLYRSPFSEWAIVVGTFDTYTINLVPQTSVTIKLNDAPTGVRTFALPDGVENHIFDPSQQLKEIASATWERGAIKIKLKWTETDLLFFDRTAPPLFLVLSSPFIADFEWMFDPVTLRPKGHACVWPEYANLDLVFSVVAAAGSQASLPYVLPYAQHRLHFLRWEAIKTVATLDFARAVSSMEDAALNDSHPEVREASARTLSHLGAR